MRSFLKIFLTVIVLAAAFVGYLLYQPGAAVRSEARKTPTVQRLRDNRSDLLVGSGESGWVRQFDDAGNLSSRFRVQAWDPRENGPIYVTQPEAELFFQARDKSLGRISIQGTDGEVVVDGMPGAGANEGPLDPKNFAAAGPMQTPSSGRLNGVVIRVFETASAAEPMLTLRTNNIVFDNEAFRISTESYTQPDGKTVPADQVAVSVEGRDFDFYGRGLTVRWNDVDERLDLLRIAHGDKLVVKNPAALSGSLLGGGNKKGDKTARDDATARAFAPPLAPLWPMLASADGSSVGAVLAATQPVSQPTRKRRKPKDPADAAQTQPRPRKEPPPYRATFNDLVRVFEGDRRVATADLMNVDFLLGAAAGAKNSTRASISRPASTTQPATAAVAETSDTAEFPSTQVASTRATRPSNDEAATTAPVSEPVTVYWVGDMTVTPSTASALPTPMARGDAGVELVGKQSPVVLTRETSRVECARFAYRTDGTLVMEKSERFPEIVLTHRPADADVAPVAAAALTTTAPSATPATAPATAPSEAIVETRVVTEFVWYSFADRIATLKGRSRVTAPLESQREGEPAGLMNAAWTDAATFHLLGERQEELTVARAEFAGDVDVNAPQVSVTSQKLELLFDPPAPSAAGDDGGTRGGRKARGKPAPATRPFANSSQPNLRRVIARESVVCKLFDAAKGTSAVRCDVLEVETGRSEAGELFPRVVDAKGSVHAGDASQDLYAGHVVLTLKPAPARSVEVNTDHPAVNADDEAASEDEPLAEAALPADDKGDVKRGGGKRNQTGGEMPAVTLESMLATDGVRVTSRDGSVATGDRLSVTNEGESWDPHVELTGGPARVADAANGELTGLTILVDPRSGVARVPGEGALRVVQRDEVVDKGKSVEAKPGQTVPGAGRPVDVSWAEGAELSAVDNRVEVSGKVRVRTIDPNGTVFTATAEQVTVALVDKPAEDTLGEDPVSVQKAGSSTRPSTNPDRVTGKGAAPAQDPAQSMQMNVFKNKDIGLVTLRDTAAVNSELLSADGLKVLQRVHLKSDVIEFDVRTHHLTIPGAGQMLLENRESDEAKMAQVKPDGDAKPDDEPSPAGLALGDGATAFQWAKRLEFDKVAGRATMDGAVVVTHQPDKKDEPSVRLDADELTAEFEPDDTAAATGEEKPREPKDPDQVATAAAATASTRPTAPVIPRLRLKAANAAGNILITRDGAELSAGRIDFDPATEWVIARGTGRTPATFTHPSGSGSASAREIWLNTRTWQVKVVDAATRVGGAR